MPRITKGSLRGAPFEFTFEGERVEAYPGETVAAALIAGDRMPLRQDSRGSARGPYCNMGTCFECLVTVPSVVGVEGEVTWHTVRSCLTPAKAGLVVRSERSPQTDRHGSDTKAL
jgi:hypothetical protein